MKYLSSLQVLRALAAMMVVVFHLHSYVFPVKVDPGFSFFKGFSMGYSGVELFFIISGFLMWRIHKNDFGNNSLFLPYAYKRIARIYPVYWLVLSGVVVLYALFRPSSLEGFSLQRFLANSLLVPLPYEPLMAVAWTLQHEVLFYSIFSIAIFNRSVGKFVLFFWSLGCCINLFFNWELFPFSFVFSSYNLLFMFGIYFAFLYDRVSLRAGFIFAWFGLFFYLIIGMLEAYNVVVWYTPLRTILYGVAGFLLLGFVRSSTLSQSFLSRQLVLIGDASYSLYLTHMPCMLIIVACLEKLDIINFIPPTVLFYLLALAAVLFSVGFYLVVEKRLINISKLVFNKVIR